MRQHIVVYGIFLALSLLILNKLLLPGYILTLDMTWPENFDTDFFGWREISYNGQIVNTIYHLPLQILYLFLNQALPSWIIQKLLIISILSLCGIGAYNLCPVKNRNAKLFAGLLYMINPFTYIRFLAGHFGVLFGYALLPFAIKYMIDFFKNRNIKNTIKLTITLALFPIVLGIHYLPVVFLFFLLFLAVNLLKSPRERKNLIKYSLLTVLLFTLISSYWLIPFLTSNQKFASSKFTEEDARYFTTKQAIDFNVIFNTAAMYGFWRSEGYILPKNLNPFWYLFFFFILFLAIHGYRTNKKDKYALPLVIAAIISLILATGITHQYLSGIFLFFYNNFPLFRGFREPQKLVAILALTYSYFGGIGLANLLKKRSKIKKEYLLAFTLFSLSVPLIYTFPMLYNGFYGQLSPTFYPETYKEVDNYINQDKDEFNILYFPWHSYMNYSWSTQRLNAVGSAVFTKPVIHGTDPTSHTNRPAYNYITFLLNNQKDITNFGELASLVNVKYIVIDKTSLVPKQPYQFLYNQPDLELIIDSDLTVFRNKAETAKIYQTDNLLVAEDWNKLLETDIIPETIPLDYAKKSPIEFILQEQPTKKYIIFTQTYSEDWAYDNQKPGNYLNLTNAFIADESKSIFYARFNYYLPGYLISFVTLSLLVLILVNRRYGFLKPLTPKKNKHKKP